ncbi:hypothetical protein C8Q73DRAFT_714637 [Cubamyces lactineus]|nr:hypothetical protein C8Q73DRAFT_714637 [Cubamyces lactineus]
MRSSPSGSRTFILCVWLLDILPLSLPPSRFFDLLCDRCSYITQNRWTHRLDSVSRLARSRPRSSPMYYSSYLASRIASSAGACAPCRVRCNTNDVL